MKETLYRIMAAFIAGIFVMILHELPKSILYCIKGFHDLKDEPDLHWRVKKMGKDIFKLWKYIDPIGLLLCVTTYTGFSKPYMYRMKDKGMNRLAGMLGFLTLICIAGINILYLRKNFALLYTGAVLVSEETLFRVVSFYFCYFVAYISINMFFINLIPISTFDLGLLIAGFAPKRYFSIIKNDHYFKIVILIVTVFGVISMIGSFLMEILLTV